jgi:NAD(P)-dependent dehydrogenase (short-subunit alcohol dehydrogenase family)
MAGGTILVTGASRGIGEASAAALIGRGEVWVSVRTQRDERRLLARHGEAVTVRRCDITNPDHIRALGTELTSRGTLVGLVNNAGIAVPSPLEVLPLDQFRHQLEVNLVGQLAIAQAVLPALRATRGRT